VTVEEQLTSFGATLVPERKREDALWRSGVAKGCDFVALPYDCTAVGVSRRQGSLEDHRQQRVGIVGRYGDISDERHRPTPVTRVSPRA
jgi:hypothetical protein